MRFERQGRFLAYVRKYARWKLISSCRRQGCETRGVQALAARHGNDNVEPVEAMILDVEIAALRKALPTLPVEMAEAIRARFFDGLTCKEAGSRLKVSATEVWNRCQDALGLLGLKVATAP